MAAQRLLAPEVRFSGRRAWPGGFTPGDATAYGMGGGVISIGAL